MLAREVKDSQPGVLKLLRRGGRLGGLPRKPRNQREPEALKIRSPTKGRAQNDLHLKGTFLSRGGQSGEKGGEHRR